MRCKMVALTEGCSVFNLNTAESRVNEALAALESAGDSVLAAELVGERRDVLMILFGPGVAPAAFPMDELADRADAVAQSAGGQGEVS